MNSEIGYGFQLVPMDTAFGLKTFIKTYSNIGLFYDILPWMTLRSKGTSHVFLSGVFTAWRRYALGRKTTIQHAE